MKQIYSLVYKQYVSDVNNKAGVHLGKEALKPEDIPSRRWVISRLHMHLRGLIEIQCKHKRYGSVIYLRDCDLVQALSSASGKSQRGSTYHSLEMVPDTCPPKGSSMEDKLDEVATHINTALHDQAKEFVEIYKDKPATYCTFNIETFKNQLSPTLLKFVETVTLSVRASNRTLFRDSENLKTKSIRRLYALCVLLFTTNTTCSMPFRVLLTEAILRNGGSTELVKS